MKNYKLIILALAALCSFAACKAKTGSGNNVDSSSNAIKKSPKDTTPMTSGMSTSGIGSGAGTGTNGTETNKGTPVGAETGTRGTTGAGAETRSQKPQ